MAIRKTVKSVAPKTKKAITNIVKKELKKDVETKVWSTGSTTSTSLTKQSLYTLSPIAGIVQGTNNNQRIGNEIYLKNLTLKLLIQNNNRQSQTYRLLVLWNEANYSITWSYNNSLGSTDIFYSGSNMMNVPPNFKLGQKILLDKILHQDAITSSGTSSAPYVKQFVYKFAIKLNKKVKFLPSSPLLNGKQLYVVLIPDTADAGSISGVTTCGAVDFQALLSYDDA